MRIGIDIDDVLADTLPAFVRYNNELHQGCWEPEHFHTAHWEEVLGLSSEAMADRLELFFGSHYFKTVGPAPHAQRIVGELASDHELHIISARWDLIVPFTEEWLSEHFPARFSQIHFAQNHYTPRASPGRARPTKDELLERHRVDILIEDSLEYAVRCVERGFDVILFDRPWNARANDPRFRRVIGWPAVPEIVQTVIDGAKGRKRS
jgi:5'(3')-deoxyribonucleotidase